MKSALLDGSRQGAIVTVKEVSGSALELVFE